MVTEGISRNKVNGLPSFYKNNHGKYANKV